MASADGNHSNATKEVNETSKDKLYRAAVGMFSDILRADQAKRDTAENVRAKMDSLPLRRAIGALDREITAGTLSGVAALKRLNELESQVYALSRVPVREELLLWLRQIRRGLFYRGV